jgi:RNA-directed DNA polymerase
MGQIAKRVEDKRLLKLIRAFLNAGVMENGLVNPSVEGTPQGGPLSPLLSNLVLDELDRELERRAIASFDMRTTVISTSAASGRGNG